MINKFLDREEAPRPTLALEYSFGRRSTPGQGIQKQVCNVWELGSLSNSNQLIEVPLKSHGLCNFTAIILLDLSQPDNLWTDLEIALHGLKQAFQSIKIDDMELLTQQTKNRVGTDHSDLKTLELFSFPIVLVGGKYDIFQDLDPEIKKHICRCLRSISHAIGSSLIFYSSKNSVISKTMRDVLNHFGFGSPINPIRSTIIDYNEPLIIPFGGDSWEKIGVVPTNSERIGIAYNTQIPQINTSLPDILNDPTKDSGFFETVIDELRTQKDEELLHLIKETEMRTKFQMLSM